MPIPTKRESRKPNNRNVNLRAQASAQDFSIFACARDFTLLDISLKESWQRRSPCNISLRRGQIKPPVQADSTFCKCAFAAYVETSFYSVFVVIFVTGSRCSDVGKFIEESYCGQPLRS